MTLPQLFLAVDPAEMERVRRFGDVRRYAEVLLQTFGARVIGLQISRNGDGLNAERRPVGAGSMPVYTIGRTQLLELFQSELQSDLVRMVDSPMSWRAYEQLANLETELRCISFQPTCRAQGAFVVAEQMGKLLVCQIE